MKILKTIYTLLHQREECPLELLCVSFDKPSVQKFAEKHYEAHEPIRTNKHIDWYKNDVLNEEAYTGERRYYIFESILYEIDNA